MAKKKQQQGPTAAEVAAARAEAKAMLERWMQDPTSLIAVFENHDLGHPRVGERIALCFDVKQDADLVIGQTKAPDTRREIGWRFILKWKGRDVEAALALVMDDDKK